MHTFGRQHRNLLDLMDVQGDYGEYALLFSNPLSKHSLRAGSMILHVLLSWPDRQTVIVSMLRRVCCSKLA